MIGQHVLMGVTKAVGVVAPLAALVMLLFTVVHVVVLMERPERINDSLPPRLNYEEQDSVSSLGALLVQQRKRDGIPATQDNVEIPWSGGNLTQVPSPAPTMIDPPKELPSSFVPLTEKDIENVQKFIFFVGYARSGHSIVASMMDAHPDVVIAHEYNFLHQWASPPSGSMHLNHTQLQLYNNLYKNSYSSAMYGWRSWVKAKKGYTLDVENSWQGSFRTLKVIGDKAAAMSSVVYSASRLDFLEIYDQFLQTVKVPVGVVHVVRNPYDMIATRLLYSASSTKLKLINVSVEQKYNNTKLLKYMIEKVIRNAGIVQSMLSDIRQTSSVLEVYLADLVRYPKATMSSVCEFVNVECSGDYLQVCDYKVYRQPPKSRLLVEWTGDLIEKVAAKMKQFSFFERYSFDTD